MKVTYAQVTELGEAVRRAGELSARTLVFDIEPLVAYWDTEQEVLHRGIDLVLGEVAALPSVQVVCFATNSLRRPAGPPPGRAGLRVVYLASAGKPLRTSAYRQFPRPGVVVGDQVATDGILAWRLGYAFVLFDPRRMRVPAGPRLMAAAGRLVRPLLFTRADSASGRRKNSGGHRHQ